MNVRNTMKVLFNFVIATSLAIFFMLSVPTPASTSDYYKRMTAAELKKRMESQHPPILLDIQKKNAYKEHHFNGSIRTYAYPAKTDYDLQSTVQGVRVYERTGSDVVIIGPRGGRASQRTVDFLITRGIPEEKIYILKGGMREWPYKDLLITPETFPH